MFQILYDIVENCNKLVDIAPEIGMPKEQVENLKSLKTRMSETLENITRKAKTLPPEISYELNKRLEEDVEMKQYLEMTKELIRILEERKNKI